MRKRCPDFAAILRDIPATDAIRNQIAECFYEELKRTARGRCGDMPSAEDALHSGLFNGLEKLASWRREGSLEAWLQRIVINACTRMREGTKNDPKINLSLTDSEGTLEASTMALDARTMIRQRLELLVSELAHIPADNADMLVLHEAQDLSLEELAVQFGLSVDGVKGRLKRTRLQLRARLLKKADELI